MKFMTEITGTSKTGVLIVKFDLKTLCIYILLIKRNRTNNMVLDLKSTFKISNIFSQIIYIVLLFNCSLQP